MNIEFVAPTALRRAEALVTSANSSSASAGNAAIAAKLHEASHTLLHAIAAFKSRDEGAPADGVDSSACLNGIVKRLTDDPCVCPTPSRFRPAAAAAAGRRPPLTAVCPHPTPTPAGTSPWASPPTPTGRR